MRLKCTQNRQPSERLAAQETRSCVVCVLGGYEVLRDGPDKRLGVRWNRLTALQNGLKRDIRAVFSASIVRVLRHHSAIKVETGEEAFGTRVCEELRVELPVGSGLGVTTHGAGRGCGISAE